MTDYNCARAVDGITHAHTSQASLPDTKGGFSLCTVWLSMPTFRAVPNCHSCLKHLPNAADNRVEKRRKPRTE